MQHCGTLMCKGRSQMNIFRDPLLFNFIYIYLFLFFIRKDQCLTALVPSSSRSGSPPLTPTTFTTSTFIFRLHNFAALHPSDTDTFNPLRPHRTELAPGAGGTTGPVRTESPVSQSASSSLNLQKLLVSLVVGVSSRRAGAV